MSATQLPGPLASFIATLDTVEFIGIERYPIGRALPPSDRGRVSIYDDQPSKTRFVVRCSQKMHSRVVYDLMRQVVVKTVNCYAEFDVVEREAAWLERLRNSGRTPVLKSWRDNVLELDYVGEPVRRHNIPADWLSQANRILEALARAGCCHNDIKYDNLMVLDGRVHLIDFGFSTERGEPIPSHWPAALGRQHRVGIHQFDDRKAIFEALQSAEVGTVDRSMAIA